MNVRSHRWVVHALLVSLSLGWVLAASVAQAQLEPQTEAEREQETQELEERRTTWTLGGHNFVAPLALRSVPFEFALPLSQLDSKTQIGAASVDGEHSAGLLAGTTHYVLATQVYDLSFLLWERFEVAAALEGQAAAGTDGGSIVAGGLGAAGAPKLSIAYQLVRLQRIAILARLGARLELGYRANIQPLLYQVQAMPLDLLDRFDPALLGAPAEEGAVTFGLSAAVAVSRALSFQLSTRGERIATLVEPWLTARGSEAQGRRELGYQAWQWSAAASVGFFVGPVLFQPQFGLSYRGDELKSPRQDRGPFSHMWSYVPALEVMYLASPVLQMGGGVGVEIASTDFKDVYSNKYSTDSVMPFVQLVARYIWGQSWNGP